VVAGHVANIEDAKVGEACFWADRSQFRIVDGDFVAGKLILPYFDGREFEVESGFGMIVGVAGLHSHNPIVRVDEMANG